MLTNTHYSFGVRAALVLILVIGLLGISPANIVLANTLVVANTNDSGAGSLRQAIANSISGDTITFDASLAGQTIILSSSLAIDKDLTIDGSSLSSNISISGNNSMTVFIVSPSGAVTMDSLIIKNGNSTGFGGGIYNSGFLTVINSSFSENSLSGLDVNSGGAIANSGGTLIVIDSIFTANSAISNPYFVGNGLGGAIYSSQGALTIINSTFTGNNASRGGAIGCDAGTLTIVGSTYSSNHALSDHGGAIHSDCSATIVNSTFSANSAADSGGAILIDSDVNPSEITNSTFYDNTASSGGGMANYAGLVVRNSTFSNNNASVGGALRNGLGGVLSLRNSILANSVGGVDCIKSDATPAIENIHNLIETTGTGAESCSTSLLTSDPLLGPLQDNGGPTETMALHVGSPAINAGTNTGCPVTDQRGVARPQDSHCDIGAYEAQRPIQISIGGVDINSYSLAPGTSKRVSFAGINSGPVKIVDVESTPLIAAQRVIYKVNGTATSFSEMMALPASQLDTIFWLPWYNNKDLNTQLRIANVSATDANVQITIGGVSMGSFTLPAGKSTRKSFPGIDKGPVKIESDQDIVAAERVIYRVNGLDTSFSEMMALPANQLDNLYWLPWYNSKSLDTQLRIANASNTDATVHVSIGGSPVTGSPFTIPVGKSIRKTFPGFDKGPVKIQSNVDIVAAERVIYKDASGVPVSFSETMALPASQVDTIYWMPWYNSKDLDTQLRIANVSLSDATVHVRIGGVEVTGSPFTVPAGKSIRRSFPGIDKGPVQIESNADVVVAERVIYTVNGKPTSFSEMMAAPNGLLDAIYWLPWYNNKELDTQLRFGIP